MDKETKEKISFGVLTLILIINIVIQIAALSLVFSIETKMNSLKIPDERTVISHNIMCDPETGYLLPQYTTEEYISSPGSWWATHSYDPCIDKVRL